MISLRRANLVLPALLLGLSARIIIPAGYMPGNLLDGEFMVLCPTDAAAKLLGHRHHAAQHGAASHEAAAGADDTCPIGSALTAAIAPAFALPAVHVPRATQALVHDVSPPRADRAPAPYSSRDPPAALA
jgi:hypothetical protein